MATTIEANAFKEPHDLESGIILFDADANSVEGNHLENRAART